MFHQVRLACQHLTDVINDTYATYRYAFATMAPCGIPLYGPVAHK